MIDKQVFRWYCNHAGTLPESIDDAATLKAMGLTDIDFNGISYKKEAENKFSLVIVMSDGKQYQSVNSGKSLPEVVKDTL